MKKLLTLAMLTLSVNSFATLNAMSKYNPGLGDDCIVNPLWGLDSAIYCTISTTTSLPTVIIQGVEINLDSPEAQERLQAELNGDVEPILLNQLKEIQGE